VSDVLRLIARRRVPFGFVCAAVAFWLARPTPRTLAAGALVAALGEALRLWAAGHLEKGREVTSSGPYRFSRHPLYLGSTLIGIGFAVAGNDAIVAAVILLYLVVTLLAAVRTEEAHLTTKFGSAYPEYKVGRAAPSPRRFSFERAMRNREYRAVLGLATALALLLVKAVL
jgi:protein-S-isoprenylcysteine O-methyltransferase Ste14